MSANGNGSRFIDITAESAVVGTIISGLFDRIPAEKLVPPRAFHDDRSRIPYAAAYSLRAAGKKVCPALINRVIEIHHQDTVLQRALDPSPEPIIKWEDWPIHCDQSIAFNHTTASAESSLASIRECFEKREALEISKQLEAGEISPGEAADALRAISTGWQELPKATPLMDFGDKPPDPARTLLGERFLCTAGSAVFVGPSGIGKTAAGVQQDAMWSIGKEAFGIRPSRPLRILGIQAEDDDGDHYEIVSGVKKGLNLSDSEIRESRERCLYVLSKSHTGPEFLSKIGRPYLAKHRPDILRLNPFQAYLGADPKDTALTSAFLRNGLNTLLEEFQCGCILVHHTPKTNFRDTTEWKASDWMYAGAGAADITNWARAIIVIDPTSDPHVFRFIAAKRGTRIGWRNEFSGEKEYVRHFAHGKGGIYWRDADDDEITRASVSAKGNRSEKKPEDLLALVSLDEVIPKPVLISRGSRAEIGIVKAKGFIAELIAQKELFEWKVPRPGTRPEIHIARHEQPVA